MARIDRGRPGGQGRRRPFLPLRGQTTSKARARCPCRGTNPPSPPKSRPGPVGPGPFERHRRSAIRPVNRKAARISPATRGPEPFGQFPPAAPHLRQDLDALVQLRDRQPNGPLLESSSRFNHRVSSPAFPLPTRFPQLATDLPGCDARLFRLRSSWISISQWDCIFLGLACTQTNRGPLARQEKGCEGPAIPENPKDERSYFRNSGHTTNDSGFPAFRRGCFARCAASGIGFAFSFVRNQHTRV